MHVIDAKDMKSFICRIEVSEPLIGKSKIRCWNSVCVSQYLNIDLNWMTVIPPIRSFTMEEMEIWLVERIEAPKYDRHLLNEFSV